MKIISHSSIAAIFALLFLGESAIADSETELIFFVSADYLRRVSVSEPTIQTNDFTPTIDTVFSHSNDRWRVLAEYFVTDDEADLERLQFGYDIAADSTIWLGRYHQPLSVWNNRYHHGAYLQPTISRPSIENWEDDGGVIVSHVAGLMLDSRLPVRAHSGLRVAAGFGYAPKLKGDVMEPFDFLNPGDGASWPAASLSLSYYPSYAAENNFGIVAGFADIESEPFGLRPALRIRQTVLGGQVSWETANWELISAAYYIDNDSEPAAVDVGGWFLAAYGQAKRNFSDTLSAFVRLETTRNARSAGYLTLFDHFVAERQLVGLRYELLRRQAITLEISDNKDLLDDFAEYRLQWSAAFP
jgi:hypothetical protein